jgi:hypothetical protein
MELVTPSTGVAAADTTGQVRDAAALEPQSTQLSPSKVPDVPLSTDTAAQGCARTVCDAGASEGSSAGTAATPLHSPLRCDSLTAPHQLHFG